MANFTAEEAKARNIEKMGQALGEQYSALWQEVSWLYTKWSEYTELFGKKSSRIDLLNKAAPSFFRMIQDTLWEDTLLHIARLTDPPRSIGKRNLTICNLIELTTAPRTKTSLPALIDDAKNKTHFCRDWRNRRIAHRDLGLTLGGSASPLEPASRQHVRDALSAIAAVLNEIAGAYLDSETSFEGVPGRPGGAISLLYIIDGGITAEAEREDRIRQHKWREQDFSRHEL